MPPHAQPGQDAARRYAGNAPAEKNPHTAPPAAAGRRSRRFSVSVGTFVPVIFVAIAVVLVVVTVTSWRARTQESINAYWVSHTQEVIGAIYRLETGLLDLETGQRGFVITGNMPFLAPFEKALVEVPAHEDSLRQLLADNSEQLRRLDELASVIDRRLEHAKRVVALRGGADGYNAATVEIEGGLGQAFMDEIRRLLDEMRTAEQQLLNQRRQEEARASELSRFLMLASVASSALFFLGAYLVLVRALRRQAEADRQLALLNQDLEARNAELARAHDRVVATEAVNSAIVDNAAHAIIVGTEQGGIHTFNPAAERMLGYAAEDVIGQLPTLFHDPAEIVARAQELTEELGVAVEPGYGVFVEKARYGQPEEREWTWLRRDGTRLPVLLSVTPIHDSSGAISGFAGMAIDISRRKEAERKLQAKNAELRAFGYTVSHDLKAPLRGIHGYAQELERRHSEGLGERARFCMAQILGAARNLDRLIEDLLRYSRIDSDQPTMSEVDLPALVQRCLDDRQGELTGSGVELAVDVAPLTVRAWERGLEQVLGNLVDNAVKYSRGMRPPRLEIGIRRQGGRIRLRVADNGIGFDMKYHDRIFGLFNRLVRSDEYEGSGAGLAIAAKIAERMGGALWAESAPGHGARFFLEWPEPEANGGSP